MENTKHKILIVDDSDIDRRLVSQILEKKGFEIFQLSSPEGVMEVITQNEPNLVLMDIVMPGFSGNDILQHIRGGYTQVDLPVIMFTSKSETKDILESLRLGANDYITKPINFEIALTRIRNHIQIAELSREMSKLKGIEVKNSMITTYNHEINNPLMIALGKLMFLKQRVQDPEIENIENALNRIAEIVKKISAFSRQENLEADSYDFKSNIYKL